METIRRILVVMLAIAGICLGLALFDVRLLVWRTIVPPGDEYLFESWGDVGNASQKSLVCRYFTGLGITTRVYWYDSGNLFGRDRCQFIVRD